MTGFECRHDTLHAGELVKGSQRLGISYRCVLRPPAILQPCVLRPDAGIIKAGGYGVCFDNLAIAVFHQVGAIAMQYSGIAGAQGGGMSAGIYTVTAALDAMRAVKIETLAKP